MNNVPRGLKKFSLDDAKAGHPLVTRDGRKVELITYVPEARQGFNLVVMIEGYVYAFPDDGCTNNENFHLFLAPLGMCEGKPVWPGDKLIWRGQEFSPPIGYSGSWDDLSWPAPKCVVETRMTWDDFIYVIDELGPRKGLTITGPQLKCIANKTIERSIADGDVIPTSIVEELMRKACTQRVGLAECTERIISGVMQDYKGQLK